MTKEYNMLYNRNINNSGFEYDREESRRQYDEDKRLAEDRANIWMLMEDWESFIFEGFEFKKGSKEKHLGEEFEDECE